MSMVSDRSWHQQLAGCVTGGSVVACLPHVCCHRCGPCPGKAARLALLTARHSMPHTTQPVHPSPAKQGLRLTIGPGKSQAHPALGVGLHSPVVHGGAGADEPLAVRVGCAHACVVRRICALAVVDGEALGVLVGAVVAQRGVAAGHLRRGGGGCVSSILLRRRSTRSDVLGAC